MPVKNTTELDAALKEIKSLDGVTHYLIMDTNGIPLKWNGWGDDYKRVVHVASLMLNYSQKMKSHLPRLLEDNDAKNFRLRTKDKEILVAPGSTCILVVFQKNN